MKNTQTSLVNVKRTIDEKFSLPPFSNPLLVRLRTFHNLLWMQTFYTIFYIPRHFNNFRDIIYFKIKKQAQEIMDAAFCHTYKKNVKKIQNKKLIIKNIKKVIKKRKEKNYIVSSRMFNT